MTYYENTIRNYYNDLVSEIGSYPDIGIIAVSHMVSNAVSFLPALNKVAPVVCVLPKPKSVNNKEHDFIKNNFRTHDLSRTWTQDWKAVQSFLKGIPNLPSKLIFIDIGGYFAESIVDLKKYVDQEIIGVLEGTENGLLKYETTLEKAGPSSPPLITVARSPLKLPEDHLVASSVVFSVEAILRADMNDILQSKRACVLGYGRVGSSVADILRGRGLNTEVYDIDPIKLAEAAARGFKSHLKLENALSENDLIISATGNKALDSKGFSYLKNGSIIAAVTSSDDEFDLQSLDRYSESSLGSDVTEYDNSSHIFYLLYKGNAVNFRHGAVIGSAMQLIEGEKIASIKSLITQSYSSSSTLPIYEVANADRILVATIWNKHFLD